MRRAIWVAGLLLVASRADAAGMYFTDRGVRPMGRAGAFVAGADDLGALWYNPAGLTDAQSSLLVDFAWLHFTSRYARRMKVLDADDTLQVVDSPAVDGSSPIIPIPTIAGSYAFGEKKEFTFAAGLFAPYIGVVTYPETVDGRPSPGRYALNSYDGSLAIIPGIWLAWKPFEWLRLGVGAMMLTGVFETEVVFAASPEDRLIGAPEQPEYDARARIRVGPIFAPSANGGVILSPDPHVRIGLSGQLPMIVSAAATLKVRLPTSSVFDNAHVVGENLHVDFALPAVARAGIEVRPVDRVRAEVAYVRELWTTHHAIDATPKDIAIEGIVGLPQRVNIPTIHYPRNFENSNSFRLGGEVSPDIGGYRWDFRAGVAYETSAVPKEYLSLQTIDLDKITLGLGIGIHIATHWRFDALYGHVFAEDVYVDPDEARIGRVNPLKGNAPLEPINGGTYRASADLLGIGANYVF